MRLFVHHQTTYSYPDQLTYSVQRLCLTPADFNSQKTLAWNISGPGVATALVYVDCFGNTVHLATVRDVPGPVSIVAEGIIESENANGVVRGLQSTVPDGVFLRQTEATLPTAEMLAWFHNKVTLKFDRLESLHELMDAVHQRVAFVIGVTSAVTTAAQAFADKRGVCQDHAHIFIGLARSAGIPARYVTGYLMTGEGNSSTAAHAWAEALVPHLGWVGFDAANNISPTDHYVRIAAAIEAANITPVRGSRRGGGALETMDVAVRVEIAQQ